MPRNFYYLIGGATLAQSIVTSFFETGVPRSPELVQNDNMPSRHHFLRPNPNPTTGRPFVYADCRDFVYAKVSAGIRGLKPDGGTLVLTIEPAGDSVDIPYNADGDAVQALLRAGWASSGFANCIVTGDEGGPWEIHTVDLNPNGETINATTTQLSPEGSTVEVVKTQEGSVDQDSRWLITQTRKYAMFRSIWTESPDAAITTPVVIAGSGTANKVYGLNWTQGCYEGAVWLTVVADGQTAVVGPIAYNATAQDVVDQLIQHPGIEADVDGGEDEDKNIAVQKTADGRYTITFRGDLGLTDAPTIAEAGKTLEAPKYLEGNLPCDAALFEQILAGENSISVTFEVEIAEEDANNPVTIVQVTDATFLRGLIGNSPAIESDQDEWLSADNAFRILADLTDYEGGTSDKLDGFQTTLGRPTPRYYMMLHPTDGMRPFVLREGTDAEVAGLVIRPADYAAVTNEKVYVAL